MSCSSPKFGIGGQPAPPPPKPTRPPTHTCTQQGYCEAPSWGVGGFDRASAVYAGLVAPLRAGKGEMRHACVDLAGHCLQPCLRHQRHANGVRQVVCENARVVLADPGGRCCFSALPLAAKLAALECRAKRARANCPPPPPDSVEFSPEFSFALKAARGIRNTVLARVLIRLRVHCYAGAAARGTGAYAPGPHMSDAAGFTWMCRPGLRS